MCVGIFKVGFKVGFKVDLRYRGNYLEDNREDNRVGMEEGVIGGLGEGSIDINLEIDSRVNLSLKNREVLLKERQEVIERSIQEIQNSFLKLGKALAEIKKFKLYKADPLYPFWKDYLDHRVKIKLHQSTISDYIAIFQMCIENKSFISEESLVKLGYKKSKLLKSKLNLIKKEKDIQLREKLYEKFKLFYQQSFKEFRDIPYSTYQQALELRLQKNLQLDPKKRDTISVKKSNKVFNFKWDKVNHKIIISVNDTNQLQQLESLFYKISNIK